MLENILSKDSDDVSRDMPLVLEEFIYKYEAIAKKDSVSIM